jgi:hypothetical protein
MWIKQFVNKLFNDFDIIPPACHIIAYRPKEHPKGEKFLMRIPVGGTIPKGVILGKGTVIEVEI